jgi:formate hydrogenlyase subunit 3/multisubunit Na+/H+ antiporter MnhD subunit
LTKRIPWWAVRIFWSTGWFVFALIFLLRDIHMHADPTSIAFQVIITLLWGWFTFADIHRWNQPGGRRYFPSVKRRNRDE